MDTDKQLRLLHLSDHHLLGDDRDRFAGIFPQDYLVAVLEDAIQG
ncbi:hypothetical protein [Psittacicella hinzii]|nr:hypothetical protein [Psittacicella hinzii]